MGEDRRGLGAIFGEAVAHRLFIVVGAALELVRSANVAGAFDRRPLVTVVITFAADGAGEAAGDAVDQRILVDDELNDVIELHSFLFEQPFERFRLRSEEHTSELQSLMRISYAVFCLKK